MKKIFPIIVDGKSPDRLLDTAKSDIRKYLKRERAKALPKGIHFWDFDCRLGIDAQSAVATHPAELFTAIDALVAKGGQQFYVELLAKDGIRTRMPPTWGEKGGEKDDFKGPSDEDYDD